MTRENKVQRGWSTRLMLAATALIFVGAAGCGQANIEQPPGGDDVQVEHTDPEEAQDHADVWIPERWMWGEQTDAVFVPYGIRLDRDTKTIDLGDIPAGGVYMTKEDHDTAHLYLPEPYATHVLRQNPDALDILAGTINGHQIIFLVDEAREAGGGALVTVSPFRLDEVLRGDWDAKIPLDLNDPEEIAKGSGGYILRRTPEGGVVRQSVERQLYDFDRTWSTSRTLYENSGRSASGKLSVTGDLSIKNTITGVANFKGRIARSNWFGDTVYFDNVGDCDRQTHHIDSLDADICVHQMEFYLRNEGYAEMGMTMTAEAEFSPDEFSPQDPLLDIPLPDIVIPGAAGISIKPSMEVSYGFKIGASGRLEVGLKPRLEWTLPLGFEYVDHYAQHYNPEMVGPITIPNGGSNPDHHFRTQFNPEFTIDGEAKVEGDAYGEFKIVVGVGVPVTRMVTVKGLEFGVKLGVHGEWEPTADPYNQGNDCATVFPFLQPFGKFGLGFQFDGVLSFLNDVDVFEVDIDGGQIKFKDGSGQPLEWTDGGDMCISLPEHRYILVENTYNDVLHVDAGRLSRNSASPAETVYATSASGASGSSNATGQPDADSCSNWDSKAAQVSAGGKLWLEYSDGIVPGDSFQLVGSSARFSLQDQSDCSISQSNPARFTIRVCESKSTSSCSSAYAGSLGNKGHTTSNTIDIPGI